MVDPQGRWRPDRDRNPEGVMETERGDRNPEAAGGDIDPGEGKWRPQEGYGDLREWGVDPEGWWRP